LRNFPGCLPALLSLCLALPAAAEVAMPVAFADVTALAVDHEPARHAYGDGASQFGELWLPAAAGNAAPIVVLIHGGCWLAQFDVTHIRPLAAALRDSGYAVWAPEYRRLGEPGGGWPGTFEDIVTAIDFLRVLPVAPGRIDTSRVIFVGHSAGGHLALWAGARAKPGADTPFSSKDALSPVGIIGLAAITDLDAYAQGDSSCQQATTRLLGGGPDQVPSRYEVASPAGLRLSAPALLLQGLADTIVPLSQALALPGATVIEIPEAGHFDLIHPGTPAFAYLLSAIKGGGGL